MRERPILMSAPMVRAILAGAKTQTRRVAKIDDVAYGKPVRWVSMAPAVTGLQDVHCPYGQPGDRLWVRETHMDLGACYLYRADASAESERALVAPGQRWRPAIHMPRAASRITLEVTGVRVERLQDISYEDALAEGCPNFAPAVDEEARRDGETGDECARRLRWPQRHYATLWQQINGTGSWDANPWVWVVQFKRVEA